MTELRASIPPEPGQWAVVLDRDGVAWQRTDVTGWLRVGSAFLGGPVAWSSLLVSYGPVELVHSGE